MNNCIHLRPKSSWLPVLYMFLIFFFLNCAGPAAEEKNAVSESETTRMPIPPQNKLAPGTAKIVAHLIKIEKENNFYNCIIKVDKVLSYGMSTKPIGKGSEIFLKISPDDEDQLELLTEGTMEQKYEFTVEQELSVDNQNKWKSVNVKKIHLE